MKRELRMLYRLLQVIWGFPQTLAGLVVYALHRECPHYDYHGLVVTVWRSKSSLSLGMFLFVTDDPFFYYPSYKEKYDQDMFTRMLLVHEYGHTVQSLMFGPFYLIAVGLPSILWSFLPAFAKKRERDHISYFSVYPERCANHLGERVTKDLSIGEPI